MPSCLLSTECATRCDCAARDIPAAGQEHGLGQTGRWGLASVTGRGRPEERDVKSDRRHTGSGSDAERVRGRPGPFRIGARAGLAHPVRPLVRRCGGVPASRAERDGGGHGRRPGSPERPDRAAQGVRPGRLRLLHQLRLAQGCRADRQPVGEPGVSLVPDAAPGGGHRPGGQGRPGRDRGVLRQPAARLPARRLGQHPVPGGSRPGRPGRGVPVGGRALRRRRAGPGAAALGGFRVLPETVEFWQGRASRLHDRLRFRRTDGGTWVTERLAP